MELKERIIHGAIEEFNLKGIRFTLDDICKRIGISKKTIYTIFKDKEELFISMVQYGFSQIKECENTIYQDESLDIVTRLKKILTAMPDGFYQIDFRKIYELREQNSKVFKLIEANLETGWEQTFDLLEEGQKQGKIKPINPIVFKSIFEAGIERFIRDDYLVQAGISYDTALEQLVDILMEGVLL